MDKNSLTHLLRTVEHLTHATVRDDDGHQQVKFGKEAIQHKGETSCLLELQRVVQSLTALANDNAVAVDRLRQRCDALETENMQFRQQLGLESRDAFCSTFRNCSAPGKVGTLPSELQARIDQLPPPTLNQNAPGA